MIIFTMLFYSYSNENLRGKIRLLFHATPKMILLGTALLEGTFGYDNLSLSLLYCSNVSILRKYLEGQISEFIRQ